MKWRYIIMEKISLNSVLNAPPANYPVIETSQVSDDPTSAAIRPSSHKAGMRRMRHESQFFQAALHATSISLENPQETVAQKTEIVNQTIRRLDDAIRNTVIQTEEDKRLVSIATKLKSKLQEFIPMLSSSPVPGCCHYQGEDYLVNVVAIAEKQERVESAIKLINSSDKFKNNRKACDYFKRVSTQLKEGINIPLPDFFHATRSGLKSIIQTRNIMQSAVGHAGQGTYISCNNEGNYGYGEHAFAIDESCLIGTSGKCFTGRKPNGEVYYSLWAAVLKDIPIMEKTIAFIDTTLDDVPYVQALLREQNLNIEVVDRQTAFIIHEIFDASTKRRELPSFAWGKLSQTDYLPANMYPRSEWGTFRKFAPEGLSLQ
jgi:hypothetical protein